MNIWNSTIFLIIRQVINYINQNIYCIMKLTLIPNWTSPCYTFKCYLCYLLIKSNNFLKILNKFSAVVTKATRIKKNNNLKIIAHFLQSNQILIVTFKLCPTLFPAVTLRKSHSNIIMFINIHESYSCASCNTSRTASLLLLKEIIQALSLYLPDVLCPVAEGRRQSSHDKPQLLSVPPMTWGRLTAHCSQPLHLVVMDTTYQYLRLHAKYSMIWYLCSTPKNKQLNKNTTVIITLSLNHAYLLESLSCIHIFW